MYKSFQLSLTLIRLIKVIHRNDMTACTELELIKFKTFVNIEIFVGKEERHWE